MSRTGSFPEYQLVFADLRPPVSSESPNKWSLDVSRRFLLVLFHYLFLSNLLAIDFRYAVEVALQVSEKNSLRGSRDEALADCRDGNYSRDTIKHSLEYTRRC